MPLLRVLILLSLLAPSAAKAAPLFCYWIESSLAATTGRALGQDGRVREFRSDGGRLPVDQVIRSLDGADPAGDAIPPELMTRLRTLAVAASKGPYRDTAGTRSFMNLQHTVACMVAGTGRRPATVILEECHNSTHVNVAAAAPELMSHLTGLIATSPARGGSSDMEILRRVLAPCA